jgi:hypothetical protein
MPGGLAPLREIFVLTQVFRIKEFTAYSKIQQIL